MRALVQRVSLARVEVDGACVAEIAAGLLALVCAVQGDGEEDAAFVERKLLSLRIFPDDARKMNRSVVDVQGSLLLVSQFTLAADIGKGARPSFMAALAPALAEPMLQRMVSRLRTQVPTETGSFGSHMNVTLTNDGPVTIWLDSKHRGGA